MQSQEKVFLVNILLILLALGGGMFLQQKYIILPQEVKVITVEKQVVVEVQKECTQLKDIKQEGWFR